MDIQKEIEKRNPNYVLENRHWVSFRRHVPVVLKAVITGIICAFIQCIISYYDLSFKKEAENAILFLPLAFAFFVYVIFAGYAINRVLEESKEVSKAIITKDLDTFLVYRDEQLPILIHLPLGAVSLIIIAFALFFPYPEGIIGATSIFSLVFTLTLLYMITMELDNYESSIWFRAKTPEGWWHINIEQYFESKKTSSKKN
jgi:hypothetical protein